MKNTAGQTDENKWGTLDEVKGKTIKVPANLQLFY